MTYLDVASVVAAKLEPVPWVRGRADGYGSKIPTQLMVRLADKRWRRVYVICWSNSGTAYVIIGGKPHYMTHADESFFWALAANGQ